MEELCFHEDLLVNVLCCLPKKSLARFKCVSKQWLRLISDRKRVFPKTITHFGLVLQSFPLQRPRGIHRPFPLKFLHVDGNGNGTLVSCSLIPQEEGNRQLISSCDGFLLLGPKNLRKDDYLVYHPATRRSWYLSPPKNPVPIATLFVGLASDGRHFKLVRYFQAEGGQPLLNVGVHVFSSHIFSSKTEEWSTETWRSSRDEGWSVATWSLLTNEKESMSRCIKGLNRVLRLVLSPSPSLNWDIDRWTSGGLFLRGAYHVISSDYLYISRLEDVDGNFKSIQLPIVKQGRNDWRECLWVSEGCVNYCQATSHKIGIWTLHKGDGEEKEGESPFKWKLKHEGILRPVPSLPEIVHPTPFCPISFNDDFEIAYLMKRAAIFSYNLVTNELKEACKLSFESPYSDPVWHIARPFFPLDPIKISSNTA